MKKLIYSACILFSGLLSGVYAQCSQDTSIITPGITPDTLVWACEGEAYDQTITLVFANDTTVTTPLGPLTIEFLSYKIVSVTNLPPGLNYVCDNSNCTWSITNGQVNRGCLKFSGTPTAVYNDSIIVTVEATLNTTLIPPTAVPVPTPFRVRSAAECNATNRLNELNSASIKIFPNPGSEYFSINSPLAGIVSIEILDITGKIVFQDRASENADNIRVNTQNWLPGIYFVKVQGNEGIKTFRWLHN